MKFFAIFFILFPVFAFANLKSDLDHVIQQAIHEKRIVGTVVFVYQNGKPIYRKAFGYRDREAKLPMTKETVFRLASMTKAIVTVAVLKLVDEGKINLDDPVTKWLPDFKPKTQDGKIPTITIRQLLTHTAGLSYGFAEPKNGPYHQLGVSDGLDLVNFSLDENLKRLSNAPLLFEPGTAWNYSLATDVLGKVLEKVEKKPLPEIIQKIVLQPLNMKSTGFFAAKNNLIAVPYMDGKPEPIRMKEKQEVPVEQSAFVFSPNRAFDKNAYPSGGAGMIGTASDYVKLLESIRTGKIFLKKNSLQQLTTNQISDLKIPTRDGWGWTLGFLILKNPVEAKIPEAKGSYTWGGAYGHSFWVDPQNKLTVVVLTNTTLEGMSGQFPYEIVNVVYNNKNVGFR